MKKITPIGSLGLALILIAPAAYSADEDESYIEEIIVTAEKREENVLDVPVTMSAFSSQMIEELGMTNHDDLEQLVPGLQFQDEGQQTGQGTTIRGIGTRLAWETHPDLAVATYVDGVYTLGIYGVAPNMFDLERVEVARGSSGHVARPELDCRIHQLLLYETHRRLGSSGAYRIHRPVFAAVRHRLRWPDD